MVHITTMSVVVQQWHMVTSTNQLPSFPYQLPTHCPHYPLPSTIPPPKYRSTPTPRQVVTTYEVVKAEAGDWMGGVATGVHRVHWFRIVLDEAHYIRNLGAGCQAACKLEADFRWCLTGTPIVNKADDIYALYRFLRYPTFERKHIFD